MLFGSAKSLAPSFTSLWFFARKAANHTQIHFVERATFSKKKEEPLGENLKIIHGGSVGSSLFIP